MRITKTIDWNGDGRKTLNPPEDAFGKYPKAVSLGSARRLVNEFNEAGQTNHSGMGSMVWVVLDYCCSNGIAFDLSVHFDCYGCVHGYSVKKAPQF